MTDEIFEILNRSWSSQNLGTEGVKHDHIPKELWRILSYSPNTCVHLNSWAWAGYGSVQDLDYYLGKRNG